jgi:hypothetical protein
MRRAYQSITNALREQIKQTEKKEDYTYERR